ncbi:MAG: hypothetical protein C0394_09030 [Syntrophus sp. (in: bacteria)]|nr:hypothetical protein [Syntrophus sp. (in: bacteria)]
MWISRPGEIEVANLVRDGITAKEIAGLLNLSIRSIEFHKDNIRLQGSQQWVRWTFFPTGSSGPPCIERNSPEAPPGKSNRQTGHESPRTPQ